MEGFMTQTTIEQEQRFIRIVEAVPPEVRRALRVLMEWMAK